MATVQILLLEHDDVEGLYPFTDTHCSWEIRTGHYTILERWTKSLPGHTVSVVSHRDLHLRSFVERHPETPAFVQAPTLLVASHVLLSPEVMRRAVPKHFLLHVQGLQLEHLFRMNWPHRMRPLKFWMHSLQINAQPLNARVISSVGCGKHLITSTYQLFGMQNLLTSSSLNKHPYTHLRYWMIVWGQS